MITRRTFLASVPALLGTAAAGCRNDGDGRTRIRIWHQKDTAERLFFEQVVDRYNARQTDHYVEVLFKETEELRNSYIIAASGGQGPEIFFGPSDNVGLLELTETIRPLDDLFDTAFLSRFTDDGLVRWNDGLYLIGDQVGNHLTLVYNRALVDPPPGTTDALIETGRAVTRDLDGDGRTDVFGLTWNYREPFFFVPFLTGFGGWLLDDAGRPTLDTPETARAIRLILELRDTYGIIPKETDYDTAQAMFNEQRAGMIINGPWAFAGYGDAGVDYGLAPLPVVSETGLRCAPMVATKGFSVNVNCSDEKLPLVRRVLEHLTGPEVQEEMARSLSTIPVHRDALGTDTVRDNPILQASLEQIRYGRPIPLAPQLRQVWDGMRGPYQLVMNGAVTPEDGARLMQANAEKLIADTFL